MWPSFYVQINLLYKYMHEYNYKKMNAKIKTTVFFVGIYDIIKSSCMNGIQYR